MTMPTKEQWAEVEKQLSGPFGRVKMMADGYEIVAEVRTIAPLQSGIIIFVNGVSKGEWFKGECEEARKFLQEKKRFLYPAKTREEAKKWLRKRIPAEMKTYWKGMAEKTLSHWYPYWTNPKAMTRQWRKTCTSIEVLLIGYEV